jgi:protein-disulfide isomerase
VSTQVTAPLGTRSTSQALLAGIPQQGLTLGRPNAPAAIVEFVDPQCPYCGEWSTRSFPDVVRRFVRTGEVRLQFVGLHFLDQNVSGSDSERAVRAVYAAGLQDRAWNMVEDVYARQGVEGSGWVTDELLHEAGTAAGVDVERMMGDLDHPQVSKWMQDADLLASQLLPQVSTPRFVLLRPPASPQLLQVTSLEPAAFTATLSAALGT